MNNRRLRNILASVSLYGFVYFFVFVSLIPLVWIFKMSIITPRELFAFPPTILPETVTWASYRTLFDDANFERALLNSLVIAGSTMVLCLFLGSLCAYALARLRFRLRVPTMTLILAISFFPGVAIIAPLFLQIRELGLINTYWAMVLPNTVFSLPLTVWLLVAFFQDLPRELEEAARVDGASYFQAFRQIIVPLAAPGVFAAAILSFIFAWNEFLFASTFAYDETTQPITVVIPNFATEYSTDYGAQSAASIIATLPLVLLVFVFQRRIVSGLTSGSVKG